jgi:ABC-2 type transport system permease protein
MMTILKKYAAVYREFIGNSLAEATTYRLNFVLVSLMDIIFYGTALGSIDFLFDYVTTIGTWDRNHFMFFISFMLAIDHLHMTFISENFWNFSGEIRTGKLDFILLKPVSGIFVCFFRLIRAGTMINGVIPWALLVIFGRRIGFDLWSWIFLVPAVLLGLALMVAIEILMTLCGFWTVSSWGINFLRMQLQQLSRFPDFIYRSYFRKFFTVIIPILAIGSGPVQFLFGPGVPLLGIWTIGALCIIGFLIRIVWRKGVAAYESASS